MSASNRGDAVLIRTGWGQYFGKDNARYLGEKSPGPGVDAGQWLVAQGVRLTGADTATYEVRPPVHGKELFPVHMLMIADNGIYLVENANLEELGAARVHALLPRRPAAPHPGRVGVAAPDAGADASSELSPRGRGGRGAPGPRYNGPMTDAYREFEAESLFCATCRRADAGAQEAAPGSAHRQPVRLRVPAVRHARRRQGGSRSHRVP